DPNARQKGKKPTQKKSGSGSAAWVGVRSSNDTPEYVAEQPLESLSPEVELAIMKKLHTYDKIMNIQEMPRNARKDKQADDVSGEWIIFVTMAKGQGMHKLTLKQDGEDLSGSHEQLIYGPYPWIDSGVLDQIPPADAGELKATFTGSFIKTSSNHNLFYLHRKNLSDRRGKDGPFEAIFTATLSADGQTAIGQLVNSGGQYGTMLMVRRKALSRYKHLLESDTARKTELAGKLNWQARRNPEKPVSMTYPKVSKHWKQPSTKSEWRRQSKCLKDWIRTKMEKLPIKKYHRRSFKSRYGYEPTSTAT
ncbi:MAG: hypothetical protein ACYTGA_14185, partial [Planctomycetota bacterium]